MAHNCYGKFTATKQSSTLTASLDVANAQSACRDSFLTHTDQENEQESIASETFQSIDETTILFEHSIHDKLSWKTVTYDKVSRLIYGSTSSLKF